MRKWKAGPSISQKIMTCLTAMVVWNQICNISEIYLYQKTQQVIGLVKSEHPKGSNILPIPSLILFYQRMSLNFLLCPLPTLQYKSNVVFERIDHSYSCTEFTLLFGGVSYSFRITKVWQIPSSKGQRGFFCPFNSVPHLFCR